MKITVAQAIVKCLEEEGVECAFGITGSHYLAFFNALRGSRIEFISVKHEGAASLMALNYAKFAQKPALILGTAGPGAMNLLAGIAEMHKANIPCFVLTPIVPTYLWGRNSFQEDSGIGNTYSISSIMKEVTKKTITAIDPENIPFHIRDLCRCSSYGRKGPVHLLVPTDHFEKQIDFSSISMKEYRCTESVRAETKQIFKIVEELKNSTKPLLLIGQRCWCPDVSDKVQELFETFGIPVIVTASAKGLVDEFSPFFGGVLDLYGHRSAEVLVKESDTIVAIGEDFGEFATLKFDPDLFSGKKLIQVDIDGYDIARNYPVFLATTGDLGEILSRITVEMGKVVTKKYFGEDVKEKIALDNKASIAEMNDSATPLRPQRVFKEISEILPLNSMVFCDIGANGYFSLRNLKTRKNAYSITMSNYTLGQAIAGCLGGKKAFPSKMVFSISGDGAFLMHGMEIATARQYALPVIWVIFVENRYNVVEWAQKLIYGDLGYCTSFFMPDLRLFSESFGIHYFKAIDVASIRSSFKEAITYYENEKSSSIIEINYDKEEMLPLKPRTVKFIQDIKNLEDFKPTSALMKALKKVFQEKV
ncbi:MAG TPA: thiamine pyrophosphate-binding protein [Chitinivibrionales bacterium]|nr:thiamine pyrophosphate-binding protein [Chitinivibrionales bacterium]